MTNTFPVLVTYVDRNDPKQRMRNSLVELPCHCLAREIPDHVRRSIRPDKPADPTDNYVGQRASDVVIIALIRLDHFECLSE